MTATGAAVVRMCGTTLTGPLTVTGITGLVLVGGDAATGACAGNFVVGPVTLTGNTAGVEFNGKRSPARSGSPATLARCPRRTPARCTPPGTR